ncbi:MAG: guanylate kinase [Elainellaceae cyanobacterium]
MAKGRLIVLTGPSGVGKGTLLRLLLNRHSELNLSISATTRPPRPGEVHGKDYYFVELEQFQQMIEHDELLEWAEFAGNYYGTPRRAVEEKISQGDWVILEIELIGARKVRDVFPEAFTIFLLPPSLQELEQRLRSRGHDSEESISRRLQRAKTEITAAPEFDIQVVNDALDEALYKIQAALFTTVEC